MAYNSLLLYADLLLVVIMTGFLFVVWRFNPEFRGIRDWLLGLGCAAINLVLFIAVPPTPLGTPQVALTLTLEALLMTAGLFALLGAQRYIGKPSGLPYLLAPIAVALAISAYSLLGGGDGGTGFILSSIVSGGFCVAAGTVVLQGGLSVHPARHLLGTTVLLHGAFMVARPLLFTESMRLFLNLTLQIEATDVIVFEQIIVSPLIVISILLLINEDKSIQLKVRAEFDSLTGVRNRGSFFEQLNKAASLSSRLKTPLTVLVVDLDHFKAINDRYGHQAGDEILKNFVKVAKNCIRNEDDIGRLGGEEFGIFLMNTPLNQAALIAERIRASVESGAVEFGNAHIPYTASIGIAAYEDQLGVNRVIDRADQYLYFAKNKGRNRVEVATA